MAKGDGIASRGKTRGKNYGDSGPTAPIQAGGKKSLGVTSLEMKKVGRGLAKRNNQRG